MSSSNSSRRRRARTARCPQPDERYSLDTWMPARLRTIDVFTAASPWFWSQHEAVIVGFFDNLRSVGSSGLLVTRRRADCERAVDLGIRHCVTSCHHPSDAMLSKEKWRIVSHFLRHGRTIVAAGADVRFLVPVRRLVRASGHVDMAFDGRVLDGRIAFFTPDVFVAFAKPRARSFVNRVLRDIALSESTDPDVHVEGVSAADVDGAENLQVLRRPY